LYRIYLRRDKAIIVKIDKQNLPFIVETDETGHSRIDYEDGKYYLRNFMGSEKIHEELITPRRARYIMREVLKEREENSPSAYEAYTKVQRMIVQKR